MATVGLSRSCAANGVVTAAAAGSIDVELEAPPRCPGCNGACRWYAAGGLPTITVATRDTFAVGTAVIVSVADRELLRSAAIIYGVPLVGVLGGALLGFALSGSDLGAAAGAACALAAAVVAARGLRSRLERGARDALSVVRAH